MRAQKYHDELHPSGSVRLGNILLMTVFGFLMLLTRPAEAAPGDSPDYVPCVAPAAGDPFRFHSCLSDSRPPAVERYVYVDENGIKRVESVVGTTMVHCNGGLCEDLTYREFRGEAPDGKYRVYVDYMIAVDSQGQIFTYRHNVDPRGFESANVAPKVKEGVYDVWCNPLGDTCTYGDREYSREELAKHIPKADVNAESGPTWDCLGEFCMNSDAEVIGLNPFYWAYQ